MEENLGPERWFTIKTETSPTTEDLICGFLEVKRITIGRIELMPVDTGKKQATKDFEETGVAFGNYITP